jgi:hypothetical protein
VGRKSIFFYIRRGKFAKIVQLLHPGLHQAPNRTAFNRHPIIFTAAAAALPDARRVLSFGCSSGEECVTLADYFPKSEIIGADLNMLILLKARKHRSDRIRFVYASDRTLSNFGGFDAVFCMSVLRTSARRRLAGLYPFEVFQERALFLESLVRPGGLLVFHNTTYRFGDTAYKYNYERIPVDAPHDEGVFLPDAITEVEPDRCLFRRLR